MEAYSGLTDPGSLSVVKGMNKAANEFSKVLERLKSADTRTDKVLGIDDLINSEHSRGGKLLTHGYGISDIDRGDYFLASIMDYLRTQ
jgi:hypothetical protein